MKVEITILGISFEVGLFHWDIGTDAFTVFSAYLFRWQIGLFHWKDDKMWCFYIGQEEFYGWGKRRYYEKEWTK